MITKTEPKLFIVESLHFEDEDDNDFEGHALSSILHLSRIENKYFYIRTEQELIELIDKFHELRYRFLHISCHGNKKSIGTTLDSIPFKRLGNILAEMLPGKRLFLSACSAVNDDLADILFNKTGCSSIIGPDDTVNFDDAAIFWSSFYQLMFKQNPRAMKQSRLEKTLKELVALHKIPMKYYTASKTSERGWNEIVLIQNGA